MYITTCRLSSLSTGIWPWNWTARCSIQLTTTSSSVCGGTAGESRNAVKESRCRLSTLVSVDAEPYASTTRDSPSNGSLRD
jgi:hypothetical protein